MSNPDINRPTLSDGSQPGPVQLLTDWAALYPALPAELIELCMTEATEAARSQGFDGARAVAVIGWLVSARLEVLNSRLPVDRHAAQERQGSEPDMDIAVSHLSRQLADLNRERLNDASQAVFLSHSGQPADEVLVILLDKARTASYEPTPDSLRAAARAISMGRRFVFV